MTLAQGKNRFKSQEKLLRDQLYGYKYGKLCLSMMLLSQFSGKKCRQMMTPLRNTGQKMNKKTSQSLEDKLRIYILRVCLVPKIFWFQVL
jgi:hypothetical protein